MAVPPAHHTPRALDHARRTTKHPDERRRDILGAAAALIAEGGFDATSVQSIARAAGVATGTVYLYFPSKDAVLSALRDDFDAGLLDRFADVAEEVVAEESAAGSTLRHSDVVDRAVDRIVDYCLERQGLCQVIARHARSRGGDPPLVPTELAQVLADVIRAGVHLGHVHASDPDTTAGLLMLAAVNAIADAIARGDDVALHRVVVATKELYAKALAPLPP